MTIFWYLSIIPEKQNIYLERPWLSRKGMMTMRRTCFATRCSFFCPWKLVIVNTDGKKCCEIFFRIYHSFQKNRPVILNGLGWAEEGWWLWGGHVLPPVVHFLVPCSVTPSLRPSSQSLDSHSLSIEDALHSDYWIGFQWAHTLARTSAAAARWR